MGDLNKRQNLIAELERLHREQRGWQITVEGETLNYEFIAQIPTDELEKIVEGLKNDKR